MLAGAGSAEAFAEPTTLCFTWVAGRVRRKSHTRTMADASSASEPRAAVCPVTGATHATSAGAPAGASGGAGAAAAAGKAGGSPPVARTASLTGNPINVRSMTSGADGGPVREMTREERMRFVHSRKSDKPLYYGEPMFRPARPPPRRRQRQLPLRGLGLLYSAPAPCPPFAPRRLVLGPGPRSWLCAPRLTVSREGGARRAPFHLDPPGLRDLVPADHPRAALCHR